MSEARGHHYISQCYLKRFTKNGSKNSKLQVYDLGTGQAFTTAPRNVAKQRDFNVVEGLPAGHLEAQLSKFEGEVERALRHLEQARNLDNYDAWVYVLNLASLFAVRNPRLRDNMSAFYDQILRQVMDVALASRERWESQVAQATAAGHMKADSKITYEQMKDFHERGEYSIEMANAMHIGAEFTMFEPVLQTMVKRKWVLFVAQSDSGGFITSDHPACLVDMEPRPNGIYGVGFGMLRTMVVFPVTRELAAVGTFEGENMVVLADRNKAAEINNVVLQFATRQVFAADSQTSVRFGEVVLPICDAATALTRARRRNAVKKPAPDADIGSFKRIGS